MYFYVLSLLLDYCCQYHPYDFLKKVLIIIARFFAKYTITWYTIHVVQALCKPFGFFCKKTAGLLEVFHKTFFEDVYKNL